MGRFIDPRPRVSAAGNRPAASWQFPCWETLDLDQATGARDGRVVRRGLMQIQALESSARCTPDMPASTGCRVFAFRVASRCGWTPERVAISVIVAFARDASHVTFAFNSRRSSFQTTSTSPVGARAHSCRVPGGRRVRRTRSRGRRGRRRRRRWCTDPAPSVSHDRPPGHRGDSRCMNLDVQSSVHPKYTTKYHVGNWPAYDRALVQRGDITVWLAPDAIATWEAVASAHVAGSCSIPISPSKPR